LKWTASTDNQGVARYEILRNGTVLASVTGTSFADVNLRSKTTYAYQVRAIDQAGQVSALSNLVKAATSRRK
jgi:chitodextrinase